MEYLVKCGQHKLVENIGIKNNIDSSLKKLCQNPRLQGRLRPERSALDRSAILIRSDLPTRLDGGIELTESSHKYKT